MGLALRAHGLRTLPHAHRPIQPHPPPRSHFSTWLSSNTRFNNHDKKLIVSPSQNLHLLPKAMGEAPLELVDLGLRPVGKDGVLDGRKLGHGRPDLARMGSSMGWAWAWTA